jgi:hypothetical protein
MTDFDLEGAGVTAKRIFVALGLIFVVALAVVVGKRMSAEAMAVVVGVVCGVAAGIPTSVLLLAAVTRRDRQRLEELGHQARAASYPPVVVIQGGAPQALPAGMQTGYWPSTPVGPAPQRQFHVVGSDGLLVDDGQY